MLKSTPIGPIGLDPAELFAPVAESETIGLAVSGGADSLALMLLYTAWCEPKPKAIVYTVDHQLRPESRAEAAMVVAAAKRAGLTCRSLVWSGVKPSTGKQSAARQARYGLIAQAMAEDGVQLLVTAHHQRDQAETFLMRLAHGSGVSGLAGIRQFSNFAGITMFRPLLGVSVQELETLVESAGLSPAQDPSNTNPAYERTRWRNALVGLSELGLSPKRLVKAAERLKRVDEFAANATNDFIVGNVHLDHLGIVRIESEAIRRADPEIRVRVIDRMLAVVSGKQSFFLSRIEALAERIGAGANFTTTLGGARVLVEGPAVFLHREAGRAGLPSANLGIGDQILWDGRFTVSAAAAGSIAPATNFTRAAFERLTGSPFVGPIAGLRAAPLVRDHSGEIVAIGALQIAKGFSVMPIPLTS
ncbi:tRNA lysidine(34) synthetase TilS [Pelagibacterium sp.]|uniref:tRNA lysidine(34) synthetase TilS n=1 Tax=Pelagibacterium sp. TaxID=1967288 RepID=UPI003A8E1E18